MARSRRPQDHFGRRARREGFPARSVYKLQELDRRLGLLRRGARVLDLGAAPGSWTLWAAERVGEQGRVIAVDLQAIDVALPRQVRTHQADIFTLSAADLGGPSSFDVVLSDMAPATTGQRHLDQYRSFELFTHALSLARAVLAPGGSFVGKIFQGPDSGEAQRAVAAAFEKARLLKPDASRAESYEVFLAGLRLRG